MVSTGTVEISNSSTQLFFVLPVINRHPAGVYLHRRGSELRGTRPIDRRRLRAAAQVRAPHCTALYMHQFYKHFHEFVSVEIHSYSQDLLQMIIQLFFVRFYFTHTWPPRIFYRLAGATRRTTRALPLPPTGTRGPRGGHRRGARARYERNPRV